MKSKLQLYYWRDFSNFGDVLNRWLFPRLFPGLFCETAQRLFVGIGTILDENLPVRQTAAVFGSGTGYTKTVPSLTSDTKIYFLRGPLTARRLGVDTKLGLADAATTLALLPEFQSPEARNGLCFMPHFRSRDLADWPKVCRELGLIYLDPMGPVDETIRAVRSAKGIITEAMHGAIVADTLRTPWLPICFHSDFLRFKWLDWWGSIKILPPPIPQVELLCRPKMYRAPNGSAIVSQLVRTAMRTLVHPQAKIRNYGPVISELSLLKERMDAGEGILSQEKTFAEILDQLRIKVYEFASDFQSTVATGL